MKAIQQEKQALFSDNDIVKKVLSGEKALFEVIMRRYNQTLFRIIRSYIAYDDAIDDILQETYLKAYVKLDQFRGTSSFSTWLIRIAINETLMRLRSNAGKQRFLSHLTKESSMKEMPHIHDGHPEKKIIQNEMRVILEKAIDNLPEKYRIIYVMKEIEDIDPHAIAESLQITENNVQVRLHRAKGMLKEALYNLSSKTDIFTFGNSSCDKLVEYVMGRI